MSFLLFFERTIQYIFLSYQQPLSFPRDVANKQWLLIQKLPNHIVVMFNLTLSLKVIKCCRFFCLECIILMCTYFLLLLRAAWMVS